MRKLVVLLSLLALVPFAFAACGGDDDGETTDVTTPAEEVGGEAGDGAGGATVGIAADPNGQLEFELDALEAPAGSVTFILDNASSIPHDFVIEDEGGSDIAATETVTGGSTSVNVEIEPGEYTFYCSVAGHREAGMEGPLAVE